MAMPTVIAVEPPAFAPHLTAGFFILYLLAMYNVGIWSRSLIFPPPHSHPLRIQLLAGVPVGLLMMGFYGKPAFSTLDGASANFTFDVAVIGGNMILFGMLSRETLDRMIQAGRDKIAGHPGGAPPGPAPAGK
jgi:hypothetical protein